MTSQHDARRTSLGGPEGMEMPGVPGVGPAMTEPLMADVVDAAEGGDIDTFDLEGLPLVTADGNVLGTVAEVAGDSIKVSAPMAPDYWLPRSVITGMAPGGDLVVGCTRDDLDSLKIDGPAAG